MDISNITQNIGPLLKHNTSTILTGLGVAGSIGSMIMGIKATPAAQRKLDAAFIAKNDEAFDPEEPDKGLISLTNLEVVKLVWLDYLPAISLQVVTVACVVGAQSINLRKQAALISVATISETAFREYQERIAAEVPAKDRKVRDDIAAQKIADNPVTSREVIIVGGGDQLFYDGYTGRYFQTTKQKVDKTVNELNFQIINQEYASLNEFYSGIGIASIPTGEDFGWNTAHKLDLDFSTHMTDDDRPAIVLDFVRKPIGDYWKGHI